MKNEKIKIALVSFEEDRDKVGDIISSSGFRLVEHAPDFVVCYGGDGTVLYSERVYPGVPKICIRKKLGCKTCHYSPEQLPDILEKVEKNEYHLVEELKLRLEYRSVFKQALNEIQLHNKNPAKAIRFSLEIKNKRAVNYNDLIGDGVVIATPFGSTAYYYSVGGRPFEKGIGVAFNNLHNKRIKPLIIDENSTIVVKVIREEGYIIIDNDEDFIEVGEEDEFIVKRSKDTAKFVVV